jgi:hypothetical protein
MIMLYDNVTPTSHNRMVRSIPSIPILQETSILDNTDNDSMISENDIDEAEPDDMTVDEKSDDTTDHILMMILFQNMDIIQ